MDHVVVTIRNFEKFKGKARSDVENPTWFRCSNRLMEDPDFYQFSFEEICVWVQVMSISSRKKSAEVRLDYEHCERACRLSRGAIDSAIEKLRGLNILLPGTPVVRRRTRRVPATSRIQQNNTEHTLQNSTGQDTATAASENFGPKDLVKLWNEKAGQAESLSPLRNKLPLVDQKAFKPSQERFKAAKARIEENPDPEYWSALIDRILKSRGCRGDNDRSWLADFDFLTRPETGAKAFEGKYDTWSNKKPQKQASGVLQRPGDANDELQSIMTEVFGDAG